MRHPYNPAVISVGVIFLCTRLAALNHENFKLDNSFQREKLIRHLSKILCSIDLKFANIYFQFESKGALLDGIITGTAKCVPLSISVIG